MPPSRTWLHDQLCPRERTPTVVRVGKLDGRDHILLVRRLDNDVGIAIRQIDIAAGEAPRRFVARVAAPKHLADEIRLLLHD
jgi:hypothetical protein